MIRLAVFVLCFMSFVVSPLLAMQAQNQPVYTTEQKAWQASGLVSVADQAVVQTASIVYDYAGLRTLFWASDAEPTGETIRAELHAIIPLFNEALDAVRSVQSIVRANGGELRSQTYPLMTTETDIRGIAISNWGNDANRKAVASSAWTTIAGNGSTLLPPYAVGPNLKLPITTNWRRWMYVDVEVRTRKTETSSWSAWKRQNGVLSYGVGEFAGNVESATIMVREVIRPHPLVQADARLLGRCDEALSTLASLQARINQATPKIRAAWPITQEYVGDVEDQARFHIANYLIMNNHLREARVVTQPDGKPYRLITKW